MKQAKQKPNYQAFLVLGLALLAIGIATANPGLLGAGVVFLLIGLVNRNNNDRTPSP